MRSVFWQKVVGRRIRRGASWRCNIRSSEYKKLMQQCLERSGLANFFSFLSRLFLKGAIVDNFLESKLSMTVCCLHGRNTFHRRCSSNPCSLRGMIPSIRPIPSNTDSRRLGAWFLLHVCLITGIPIIKCLWIGRRRRQSWIWIWGRQTLILKVNLPVPSIKDISTW